MDKKDTPQKKSDKNTFDDYYILKNGQKQGPYSLEEISRLIEEYKLILTDLASLDGGKTWNKLASLPQFDRRLIKRKELPSSSNIEFLEKMKEDDSDFEELKKNSGTDPLINLAHQGLVKKVEEPLLEEIPSSSFFQRYYHFFLIFVLVGLGGFFFLDQREKKISTSVKKITEKKKTTPAKPSIVKKKVPSVKKFTTPRKKPPLIKKNTPLIGRKDEREIDEEEKVREEDRPIPRKRKRRQRRRSFRPSPFNEVPDEIGDLDDYDEEEGPYDDQERERGRRRRPSLRDVINEYEFDE